MREILALVTVLAFATWSLRQPPPRVAPQRRK